MNVLITSISKKTPLLNYVKKACQLVSTNIDLIGADSNQDSIARYFVDDFWHMPMLTELSINELIDYCKRKQIKVIFPTREGELAFFSKYKTILEQNGIFVMVSSLKTLKKVQDKLLFYEHLKEKGYPVIKTSLSLEETMEQSFVVKERFGAGSKRLYLNVNKEEAKYEAAKLQKPIFQPYVDGTEYSIDVYVDQNGNGKGAIVRERVLVVDGESQVTRTCHNNQLEQLAIELAEDLKLRGHVMFQVIVDSSGNPHIVECNPRFGGASTLSLAAGLDSFYWFLMESQGESLEEYPFIRNDKELTQVRYAKDLIL